MIRLLVDSASDYSMEEVSARKMERVPLSITFGEDTYIDGVNLSRDQFYEKLTTSGEFPKTSQPSPQAFFNVFEDAREKGDEVICILLSSGLSGTYQSAFLAKNMADYDGIYLVDSKAASYMIKEMADYAEKLIKQGMTAAEITEKLEELKGRVKVFAALDTLEYLAMGGRISRSMAAIGGLANIKPLISLDEEGKISVPGKSLGVNKAIGSLVKYIKNNKPDTEFPLYTLYTYGTVNCGKLEEKLAKENIEAAERMQIGPTIGAHVGPEAFGVIYVGEK